jgi:anti-sigma factor RsiW
VGKNMCMSACGGAGIDELLGAYALDALDDDERTLVEHHLAGDANARAEVDRLRAAAVVFGTLVRRSSPRR